MPLEGHLKNWITILKGSTQISMLCKFNLGMILFNSYSTILLFNNFVYYICHFLCCICSILYQTQVIIK